jgi:hypothetical protein
VDPEGKHVVYATVDRNRATPPTLRIRSIQTNDVETMAKFSSAKVIHSLSVSSEARRVAFVVVPDPAMPGPLTVPGVYVLESVTGNLRLVSSGPDGEMPNGGSSDPVISRDGRYVLFLSQASNLVTGDDNNVSDMFLADIDNGTIALVSKRADGTSANGRSEGGWLSGDGKWAAFASLASDLISGDHNSYRDVFVSDLEGTHPVEDVDGDGMDDAWERKYFGDLSHGPATDDDGDGATNLDEYIAGTSPVDAKSVFRIEGEVVTGSGSSSIRILWTGVAGRKYQVQFAPQPGMPWNNLDGILAGVDGVMEVTDPIASNALGRCYQVVVTN